jgi:hypothetical protein
MGIESIGQIDFNELTKACASLETTMGLKVRTVAVKKPAIVKEFVRQLLTVPEEREGELEDVIFSVVSDIQDKLGTETLRDTLTLLETPMVEEAPVVQAVAPVVPEAVSPVVPAPVEAAPVVIPDPPPAKKPGRPKLPKEPKEKKERKSRDGMNKVLDITRFVWSHTGLTIDEVAAAMTAQGVSFSEATLGFEYRAVHRSRLVLKEMRVIQ